jgi:N-methylhydantoinase A/oxoprolinase/acetone carboxylase beta subunit
VDTLVAEFEKVYERIFTMMAKSPEAGYRVTEVGVMITAPTTKPNIVLSELQGKEPPKKAFKGTRDIYYDGKWQQATVYEMGEIMPGNEVNGPCCVEAPNYTLYVPPGKKVSEDGFRILTLADIS